jgi:hypothetical protein
VRAHPYLWRHSLPVGRKPSRMLIWSGHFVSAGAFFQISLPAFLPPCGDFSLRGLRRGFKARHSGAPWCHEDEDNYQSANTEFNDIRGPHIAISHPLKVEDDQMGGFPHSREPAALNSQKTPTSYSDAKALPLYRSARVEGESATPSGFGNFAMKSTILLASSVSRSAPKKLMLA